MGATPTLLLTRWVSNPCRPIFNDIARYYSAVGLMRSLELGVRRLMSKPHSRLEDIFPRDWRQATPLVT